MPNFADLKGILEDIWQFRGGDGAMIKEDGAGLLQCRNSSDGADANMSGADPTAAQHFLTKNYYDTNPPAGGDLWITVPFGFGDAGSTVDSTATTPAGAKVFDCRVDITTAWDVAMTVDVGDTGTAAAFAANSKIKETKQQLHLFPQVTTTIASVVRVTCGASAATAGAGAAYVCFATPKT